VTGEREASEWRGVAAEAAGETGDAMTSRATPVPAVVERPEQLTAAWFDAVLGTAGTPASVERVTAAPVGTGQMAQTLRVRLGRAAGNGSTTVIVKLARPEVATGPLARSAYAKEIAFYAELAARLPVRTPRCHHAAIADDAASFTLVLDDLAGAVPGDQIAGCPVAHAEAAVVNLAALHGPTWCDADLAGRPWLAGDPSLTPEMLAPVLDLAADQFAERFTGDLEDHERAVLDAARQVLAPWMLAGSDTFSVIHGDYRLDNLLFPVDDPGGVAVVDWQTVSIAAAGRDLAFFLGTGMAVEDRRRHERDIVATYHEALAGHGVARYTFDQCFGDYRRGMLHGPLIILLGRLTATATERGDEMFLAMWRRAAAAITDLGTLDLVRR
jgi:Ser/Thr protein kinase RdoA (MazF antagonist)